MSKRILLRNLWSFYLQVGLFWCYKGGAGERIWHIFKLILKKRDSTKKSHSIDIFHRSCFKEVQCETFLAKLDKATAIPNFSSVTLILVNFLWLLVLVLKKVSHPPQPPLFKLISYARPKLYYLYMIGTYSLLIVVFIHFM